MLASITRLARPIFRQHRLQTLLVAAGLSLSLNFLADNPAKARSYWPSPIKRELPAELSQNILQQAADVLGVSDKDVKISLAEAVTWSDSCIGIHLPHTACMMAIVGGGWRITVTSPGKQELVYHVGAGRTILATGITQDNPVLPDISEPGTWIFERALSGRWFDPPTAFGFRYTMLDDAEFTNILGLPVGIDADNLFTISVDDVALGTFSPGDTIDFVELFGRGVSEFTVTDIDAPLDLDDPEVFPIQLGFDRQYAAFKMQAMSRSTSVPEPGSVFSLAAFSLLSIGYLASRRS